MQEFQSIPGLAGRLFGGGAGASDLRRAHHLQHHQAHQHGGPGSGGARCGGARCGGGVSPATAAEAVKCPRCESTNTKFCYYNNYNLSQPRHFCKSCRRYWTKGGVLRNVPVGGGCRKAKRSSASQASASSSSTAASSAAAPSTPTTTEANKNPRRASASSPRSNSNSGSSTSPATTTTTTPTVPIATPSSSSNNVGLSTNNPFSTADVAPPAPIFADQAAALASLFAPPPLPVFSFAAAQAQQQPKDEGVASAVTMLPGQAAAAASRLDESSAADMAPFTSLDAGIFEQLGDDSSAAAAYWNAGGCWTEDPSVYLP